jgi:hypothetical protein
MYITCNAVSTHLNHKRIFLFFTRLGVWSLLCIRNINCKPLQEKSLDIGRALKSVTLGHISLDCKANVEQFNHQCVEGSIKRIYELLDIEVKNIELPIRNKNRLW